MARVINRWAVVPPDDVPSHLVHVEVFNSVVEAARFAEQTRGKVLGAIDVDALIEHQKATAA